ncbi:scavenger receptor cysteine-rich type 1 protein M130 [Strongylocentrotus purpuratus]|uniref:SRCR domain-containing protein n=1 Tax=Strongylocentrotus purpuratus TaxID=7668 RepID=A0A7M7GEU3_STRPU|nr:scavenger receptor cysteine-rich type 1 protein M130 [Strongylocentrotus purpuratus]|eukprot:XP_003724465.1 PREDICTED: scavenger receptor cysteine-rich type 1 protein M130 [Strongylocentrotus purpuratus]
MPSLYRLPLLIVCLITFLGSSFAQSEGDLRLSDGTTYYGRLEIYYNSTWSTISNKTVGDSVPRVACRELGLPFTEAEFVRDKSMIFTPADSEYVLVTRISCYGDEVRLTECYQFDWILVQFYTHKEDLAIVCKGEIIPTGELRLDGGSDRLRGRLEIYSGTSRGWSPFCSIGFGVNESAVACRQLGLNTSQPYVYGYDYFGSAPDYLSGQHYTANCAGDEDRIDGCDNLYLSHLSNDPDERQCRIDDVLSICCSIQPETCDQPASPVSNADVAGGLIAVILVVIAICAGCYISCRGMCKKRPKPPQQYTAVSQGTKGADQNQFPMTSSGDSKLPVYVHGHATAETPASFSCNPSGVPPPAPAGSAPYQTQPYPYPTGQVSPPTGAYPAPSQPGYNPTAATNQYPPQPAKPYPPQISSMSPPYGAPYQHPTGASAV